MRNSKFKSSTPSQNMYLDGVNNRRLLPLQEAASQLSMCRQTLMVHVRAGRLKCVRVASNAVYFRPAQLEEFIDSHVEGFSPSRVPKG